MLLIIEFAWGLLWWDQKVFYSSAREPYLFYSVTKMLLACRVCL